MPRSPSPARAFHTRLPPFREVPVEEIVSDPSFRHDPQLLKLFLKADAGAVCVAFTRIRTDLVTSGFFMREAGATIHVSNLEPDNVPLMERMIRFGNRPPLALYWSRLSPHESKLVCSDDEATLAAYIRLGIKFVPAMIYHPGDIRREEGAIWTRMNAHRVPAYDRAMASEIGAYAALPGLEGRLPSETLGVLIAACASRRADIRAFHLESSERLHYHHMLHAFLKRHERVLATIGELLESDRAEQACALVRMAYEAFLGFYIDWLAPNFIGPRLQLVSHLGAQKGKALMPERKKRDEGIRKSLGGFETFLTSVAEKARISPLGERFHSAAYPTLSWMAHQAYGILEPEAMNFEEDRPQDDPALIGILLVWLNVITTALLQRIGDDVGAARRIATAG